MLAGMTPLHALCMLLCTLCVVEGKSLPHVTNPWHLGGMVAGSHETGQPYDPDGTGYPVSTDHLYGQLSGDRIQPGTLHGTTESAVSSNTWGTVEEIDGSGASHSVNSTAYTGSPYIYPSYKVPATAAWHPCPHNLGGRRTLMHFGQSTSILESTQLTVRQAIDTASAATLAACAHIFCYFSHCHVSVGGRKLQ